MNCMATKAQRVLMLPSWVWRGQLHITTHVMLLPTKGVCTFTAKLHYTDTGYEHQQRTPPITDELTTILQQICHIAMPEPNISTCQDVGMWQILSVGGVRWWCS